MKEKKTYKAEYVCINCKNKMTVEIVFGNPIPIFVRNPSSVSNKHGMFESPPCKHCGCKNWNYGKPIS
jgi:hypothetical protein